MITPVYPPTISGPQITGTIKVYYRPGYSFFSAFTPAGTGGDTNEWIVPYSPKDGTTVLTFTVRVLTLRINNKQAVTSTIRLEKSGNAIGAVFGNAVNMQSGGDLSCGSSVFGNSIAVFSATCQSGDVLRLNVIALGAGDTLWNSAVYLESTTQI